MSKPNGSLSAIRAERNRFVAFTFASADLVIEADASGRVAFAAGAGEGLFGHAATDLAGRSMFELFADYDRPAFQRAIGAMEPGRRLGGILLRIVGLNGAHLPMRVSGYRLPDMPDKIFVALSRSIPNPAPAVAPTRDTESGLLDRQSFGDALGAAAMEARAAGVACEVTLLGLPDLERVRGTLDADADQALILNVSALLEGHAVDGTLAGRLDSDRFGVVLDGARALEEVSGRIKGLVADLGVDRSVFSVAACSLLLDADGMDESEAAQAVLFTLNRFCESREADFKLTHLSEGCRVMHAETLQWVERIKRTIRDGAFSLAFQPIVALEDDSVHHVEALSRFPDEGDPSPYEFITMAERLDLIGDFDLSVLDRVARLIGNGKSNGASPAVPPVAVNISGRSLTTAGFADRLLSHVEANRALREVLLLEVTESSKIVDLPSASQTLAALRKMGVRVCLDDFGVGAAAFDYLREIDVDFIKIDGSFVREAAHSRFGRAFVFSISSLCSELGIGSIAEQIEDEATADRLREAGVTHGQGFLYGRPAPELLPSGMSPPPGRTLRPPRERADGPVVERAAKEFRALAETKARWDPVRGCRVVP